MLARRTSAWSFWSRLSCSVAAILLCAGPVHAHGGNPDVRAVVAPLPPALSGMRVEVYETVAPQLVIENTTQRTVEILDDTGAAFVRVGPRGVEANLTEPAWYRTYSPGAPVPARAQPGGAARWVRVSADRSFGWFDPRLNASNVAVPSSAVLARRAIEVGRWQVALRVDGVPAALSGWFHYQPKPTATYRARLTSPARLADGVRVTVLPGNSPGLMIQNATADALIVLGADGEPFLRIGPAGVEANLRSTTWWESARSASARPAALAEAAEPQWERVASSPRFSWIDPRARASQWRVPVHLAGRTVEITGSTLHATASGQ